MVNAKKIKTNAINIFKYLEELFSLNIDTRRDFRNLSDQEKILRVKDFPKSDNLFIKSFGTQNEDPFLSVEKKELEHLPKTPKELVEWIDIDNIGFVQPAHKEFILRKIRFSDNRKREQAFNKLKTLEKQGTSVILQGWITKVDDGSWKKINERDIKVFFSDFPELQEMYENYILGPWEDWKKRNEPIFRANQIYDDLYGVRTFLKTESESFDLFWTHDLLTWKKENEKIYHPLFLTPVSLEFSPEEKKIEIRKDNSLKTVFETSFLDGLDISNIIDIYEESKALNLEEYDVWNLQALKLKGSEIVGYLSPDGVEKFSEDILEPQIHEAPTYWNFPTILLRKRSNIDWAKYAKKIQQDIADDKELPAFIAELAGDTDGPEEKTEEQESTSIFDGELYFPLPWNDEQKQIANKIEARYGLVVQGPPGTGKSHTIANLLSRFLAQGKSVLVTSQTGQALGVLKNMIPREIKDLVVSQIESDSRRDDLQASVTKINANLDDTTKFTAKKIEETKEQLKEIRKTKASLLSRVKRWALLDIQEKLSIEGKYFTPIEAAKELSTGRNNGLLWLKDEITKETELNFIEEDIVVVSELLLALSNKERNYFEQWIPEVDHLPHIDEVEKFFEKYEEANTLNKRWEKYLSQKKLSSRPNFEDDKIRQLLKGVKTARDVLNGMDKRWEKALFALILKNKDEKHRWQDNILKKLGEKSTQIRKLEESGLLEHNISHNTELDVRPLLDAVIEIEKKIGDGESLSWIRKISLSKNAKAVLENALVDSSDVRKKESLLFLKKNLSREQFIQEIRTLWDKAFENADISDYEKVESPFVLHRFDDRLKGVKRTLAYEDSFYNIKEFIDQNPIFSELIYTDKKSIEKLIVLLESLLASFDLEGYKKVFTNWKNELNKKNAHQIIADIFLVINNRDSEKLKDLYQKLSKLQQKKKDSEKLQQLKEKISKFAPKLFRSIQEEADSGRKYKISSDLAIGWRLARISSWLKEIHSDKSIAELQKELDRTENQEKNKVSELIAISAWMKQKEKVTRAQREALSAYALSIKKLGKGTGKYASLHRKNAQDALKIAKNAVPIWIMPLGKVLHMFAEPKAGMFDIVIFDESSQIDVRGITIAYLGKKLLVVGDPEQISPTSFIRQDEVVGLIGKYLANIPNSVHFSVTSSFFDIAEMKMSGRVMLLEHFRSVEEIINFSNKLSYDGRLKILRYPHPKWHLKPALEAKYIESGFMNLNNQVNELEAEKLVDRLVELLNDPKYDQRDDGRNGTRPTTFGVVTLLGNDQGKFITGLIRQKISEEEIEKRKIVAGNPYAFQGDERDVMLISMVKAPDQNDLEKNITPLTINKKENKQRVNVAMSRARDKMILFHSLTKKELNSEIDLRAQILDWFYNPRKEEIKWGHEALKQALEQRKHGPFEFPFDVGNIILNKGYKVIPEFEVAGYSIDLVIQGENTRLAVECNGDQYHGPDKWADDFERENILRRAGWEFWTVTGSAFYKHDGEALKSLWSKLQEMGIRPIV